MDFSDRRLITAATMTGLLVVLVVMAVLGFKSVTSPFNHPNTSKPSGPGCSVAEQTIKEYLRRNEVTVSVYNAGGRKGFAQKTMDRLEGAGFQPGQVGNAPSDTKVDFAEVLSTRDDDPAATLVAQILGADAEVVTSDAELGPGVNVYIGKRFKKLDKSAPRKIKLAKPVITCVPVS